MGLAVASASFRDASTATAALLRSQLSECASAGVIHRIFMFPGPPAVIFSS